MDLKLLILEHLQISTRTKEREVVSKRQISARAAELHLMNSVSLHTKPQLTDFSKRFKLVKSPKRTSRGHLVKFQEFAECSL